MKDPFTWLTPKQAAQLVGYTTRHMQKLITSGKLSATKEDGKYYIEKSEFFRVFPSAHKKEQEGNISLQQAEKSRLESENNLLKELSDQKGREIEFLRNQIEYVAREKEKMLDAIVSHARILEHKSSCNKGEIINPKRSWRDFFKRK